MITTIETSEPTPLYKVLRDLLITEKGNIIYLVEHPYTKLWDINGSHTISRLPYISLLRLSVKVKYIDFFVEFVTWTDFNSNLNWLEEVLFELMNDSVLLVVLWEPRVTPMTLTVSWF